VLFSRHQTRRTIYGNEGVFTDCELRDGSPYALFLSGVVGRIEPYLQVPEGRCWTRESRVNYNVLPSISLVSVASLHSASSALRLLSQLSKTSSVATLCRCQ
jgi:hypothetical protein